MEVKSGKPAWRRWWLGLTGDEFLQVGVEESTEAAGPVETRQGRVWGRAPASSEEATEVGEFPRLPWRRRICSSDKSHRKPEPNTEQRGAVGGQAASPGLASGALNPRALGNGSPRA